MSNNESLRFKLDNILLNSRLVILAYTELIRSYRQGEQTFGLLFYCFHAIHLCYDHILIYSSLK
jgi:hypothetical protein